MPKWKRDHLEFIHGLRAARGATGSGGNNFQGIDSEEPGESYTPVARKQVQCPHCLRKFDEDPAERHIPKCKNIINRPKGPTGITRLGVGAKTSISSHGASSRSSMTVARIKVMGKSSSNRAKCSTAATSAKIPVKTGSISGKLIKGSAMRQQASIRSDGFKF
mmetsp:Transcript_246/g.269  ORF Transcript_246/g.269 Transcript_246/m.269 type:complete len:163 (+) Transcript_246:622-1110(+)